MKFGRKFVALAAAVCLSMVCLGLVACGNSASSSAASSSASASSAASSAAASESASASSESASASAANTADKFVGTWTIAAAESQGVTMAGNFGEMIGMSDTGNLTINADGTGEMKLGDEGGAIKWEATGDDAITITAESSSETVPVTYKNDALFMEITQDGQTANAIFTKDGVYADAKQIDKSQAKPITSEGDLLGTWKLTGMVMMGITIYGDADSLSAMSGDVDQSMTFEQGGTFKSGTSEGTWAVDANGATISGTDITGEYTSPLLMQGDMLLIDMSEAMQGMEFILVYEK